MQCHHDDSNRVVVSRRECPLSTEARSLDNSLTEKVALLKNLFFFFLPRVGNSLCLFLLFTLGLKSFIFFT